MSKNKNKKDVTLLGFIGETCKAVAEAQADSNSPVATVADVEDIVREMVNETFINSVSAKSDAPTAEVITLGGEKMFFANGTSIVIKEREDGEEGALITWDGGELLIDNQTTVFGGRHDDETLTNSDIVMEGGYVRHVIGGGLHKSHTVKSHVVMKGGKVRSIRGGAADQWISTCTCTNRIYEGDISDTWAVVEDVTMELLGGEVEAFVYGGGCGYSSVKTVSMVVEDGFKATEGWVTAGGANGHEGVGALIINGGEFNIVQGINRGTMDAIDIVVNGGKIAKLFAGGEIPFIGTPEKPNSNDPHGTFKSCKVTLNGGEITEFSLGGNAYAEIVEGDPCVTVVDNR